jgi:hypothetical protein
MAQVGGVEFSTRRECLEAFAKTMGVFPPRAPIPEWWESFTKWYDEVRADENLRKEDEPNVTSLLVRMEAFTWEDDDEDDESLADDDYGRDWDLVPDDDDGPPGE